jgi:hypothetical protein
MCTSRLQECQPRTVIERSREDLLGLMTRLDLCSPRSGETVPREHGHTSSPTGGSA